VCPQSKPVIAQLRRGRAALAQPPAQRRGRARADALERYWSTHMGEAMVRDEFRSHGLGVIA
jgi:hypothetical protein